MNEYPVIDYYLEVEPYNIRPREKKDGIFLICNCGGKAILPPLEEKTFGRQLICPNCKNLLATVGKKVTTTVYISGKRK